MRPFLVAESQHFVLYVRPAVQNLLRHTTEGFCDIGEDSADARRLEVGLELWLVQFGRCGGGDPSFGNLSESQPHMYRSTINNIVGGVARNLDMYVALRKALAGGRNASGGVPIQ